MATKVEPKLKKFIVKAYIGNNLELQFTVEAYYKINVICFYEVMYGKTAYKIVVEEEGNE